MIFRTPFFLPLIYPQLVWKVRVSEKKIFLTFDDGPIPGPTEFVLEVLKKYDARATFFCIGDNVRKHPELFQKILDQGNVIGNHTFNHLKGWKYSTPEYVNNVALCEEQLGKARIPPQAKGILPLFRPPYGRIKRSQINALNSYRIIMWDVLTHDYQNSYSPERSLTNSIKATREGSIVVFHDSIKAERNMKYILPRYIDHFCEKGFSFETL